MYAVELKCISCSETYPLIPIYECEKCQGILEVSYDYEKLKAKMLSGSLKLPNDLLPIKNESAISLGEGNTPLLKSEKLANSLGIRSLYFKCEFANPTGSFKDRPVSIGIAKAVEFGYKKVIVASSGNGAAAVAAYGARAGLDVTILVPKSTPIEKVTQALQYGAKVIRVEGPYSQCFSQAKKASEESGMYNITTTFLNPYTVEGDKTISYELFKAMVEIPDAIFVPIGAGPLLVGIGKGYKEIQKLYGLDEVPRMVGVQASGCNPIARAFNEGRDSIISESNPSTIAGGIADGLNGYAKDGDYTLATINKTNGFALDVSDEEIMQAQKILAHQEGIFVEPSAAAGVAGLMKSIKTEQLNKHSTIVVILTGHGLKDLKNVSTNVDTVPAEEID